MASVKCAAVMALATTLVGCCGWDRGCVAPSASLRPAWDGADRPPYQDEEASQPTLPSTNRRQVSAPRMPSRGAIATNTRPVSGASALGPDDDAPPTSSFKPLSPEWWAAEHAKEDRLRKRIIICSNCLPPVQSVDAASRAQSKSAYDHDVANNETFLQNVNSSGPRATE